VDEEPVASAVVRADGEGAGGGVQAIVRASGRVATVAAAPREPDVQRTGDPSPVPGVPSLPIVGTPRSSRPTGGCPRFCACTLAMEYAQRQYPPGVCLVRMVTGPDRSARACTVRPERGVASVREGRSEASPGYRDARAGRTRVYEEAAEGGVASEIASGCCLS